MRGSALCLIATFVGACHDTPLPTVSTRVAPALDADVGSGTTAYQAEVLPLPPNTVGSSGASINNNGDVVGTLNGAGTMAIWIGSTPMPLGAPSFAPFAAPTDVNDARTVVGYGSDTGRLHGFIWKNGVFTEIVTPAFGDLGAIAVNNSDVVVGSYRARNGEHAFVYTGGRVVDIHPSGGYLVSRANDISDAGVIVGTVALGSPPTWHAARWTAPDWTFTDLGSLGGAYYAEAFGVNAAGAVVGTTFDGGGVARPFYWTASLGMVAGPPSFRTSSISDRNRYALTQPATRVDPQLAATARGRSPVEFLTLPPGSTSSQANRVNRCGAIVGTVYFPPMDARAVRWTPVVCD